MLGMDAMQVSIVNEQGIDKLKSSVMNLLKDTELLQQQFQEAQL